MAGEDATMSDYFQRFIVPLAALFIGLRILAFLLGKIYPISYAFICRKISERHHKAIKRHKDKLFSDISALGEAAGADGTGNKRIFAVEIGCGPGSNFGIYPPNTSLIVVEPNAKFQTDVAKNAAQHPSLEVTKFLNIGAEDLRQDVEDGSQDLVVSTLSLCSVRDLEAVVGEAHRVLKPGGRFYFIEHTEAHQKQGWTHLLQRIAAPIIYLVAGCVVNRTPWVTVDRAGFSRVQYTKTEIRSIPTLFQPHVFGYAVK